MKGQAAQHQRFRGIVTLALVGILTFAWGASEAWAQGTEYVTWTFVQGGQVFTGIAVTSGTAQVTTGPGQTITVSAGQYITMSGTAPPTKPAPIDTAPPNIQQQIKNGKVETDPSLVAKVDLQAQLAQAAVTPGGTTFPQNAITPPCTPVFGTGVVGVTVVSPAGEPILGTTFLGCR